MAHTILPLTEQIVLVTGGARGLRAAITRAFLAQGARVVIDYHTSQDAAEDLAAAHPGKAIAIRADVRDRAQVDALVAEAADRFGGPITTVVNNALADFSFNGDARSHADQISYEEITAQFTGSVHGPLNVIQATLPGMVEAGFGRIVNIGTNLFQHPVALPRLHRGESSAAVPDTHLRRRSRPAGHHGEHGLRGLLLTTDASAATPEAVFEGIAAGTPLRAVTTPDQLADPVVFFASPWARGVTGQNLIVDGGLVKG